MKSTKIKEIQLLGNQSSTARVSSRAKAIESAIIFAAFGFFFVLSCASAAFASPKLSLIGTLQSPGGRKILLIEKNGQSKIANPKSSGAFSFKNLTSTTLKNASLHLLTASGGYGGPLVLSNRGAKAYLYLSGKAAENTTVVPLGKIQVKTGYAKTRSKLADRLLNKVRFAKASTAGVPLGAANLGFVDTHVSGLSGRLAIRPRAELEGGADLDGDGVPNVLDVDDDGDQTMDSADPDSAHTTAEDNPFTTLYMNMPSSLNVNIGSVSQSDIDAAISGEGYFNLIMFLSLPPGTSYTGAHVICDDALTYCRPNGSPSGAGSAVFTGLSETDPDLNNQPWADYNADGSGYPNLAPLDRGGSQSFVAGIQPRADTSAFKAGDLFRVQFMSGAHVASTRLLSLAPYFVTVPVIKSYNAGAGVVTVDYSAGSIVGASSGNPIVLDTSGVLQITAWRPQRLGIAGAGEGDFMDFGHLHYGVIVGGLDHEFTCAGLYSGLSADLTDHSSESTGISPQDGAILWPLQDNAGDTTPSPSQTISFSIDLKTCLSRAEVSPGTYSISLTAAGESLAGGANRAAQLSYVTIP